MWASSGSKGRQVFIGGLSLDVDAEALKRLCVDVGGVVHATVWKDGETERSKGAGKLEFETGELALKAVEVLRSPSAVAGSVSFATVFTDVAPNQVDVQYDKASDWLVSRGKLPKDWRAALTGTQAKVAELGDGGYFKAKDAEKEGKEHVRQILEEYEGSNGHIAEALSFLVRLVRYEIPAARKHAQLCQKQLQDAEHRQADVSRQEAEAARKFREMCEAHQIAGADCLTELQERLRTVLPQCLESAAEKIRAIGQEPIDFYSRFSQSLLLGDGKAPAEKHLSLLRLVTASGNIPLKEAVDTCSSEALQTEWRKVQEKPNAQDTSILANTCARGLLATEILELEAFLSQCSSELEEFGEAKVVQCTEEHLGLQETKSMQQRVAEALEALSGKDVQPLLLLQSSEAALRNAASKLSAQKALCERLGKKSPALGELKADLSAEAASKLEEAACLEALARGLKAWLEEALSQLMKHQVRLAGEVTAI